MVHQRLRRCPVVRRHELLSELGAPSPLATGSPCRTRRLDPAPCPLSPQRTLPVSVTFPQPQWPQFGLHSSCLLDVFSQETNLAPRKRGLFLYTFVVAASSVLPYPDGMRPKPKGRWLQQIRD